MKSVTYTIHTESIWSETEPLQQTYSDDSNTPPTNHRSNWPSRFRRCLCGLRRIPAAPSAGWGNHKRRSAPYWRTGSSPTALCNTPAPSHPSGLYHPELQSSHKLNNCRDIRQQTVMHFTIYKHKKPTLAVCNFQLIITCSNHEPALQNFQHNWNFQLKINCMCDRCEWPSAQKTGNANNQLLKWTYIFRLMWHLETKLTTIIVPGHCDFAITCKISRPVCGIIIRVAFYVLKILPLTLLKMFIKFVDGKCLKWIHAQQTLSMELWIKTRNILMGLLVV